jgi:hypothetical protein
MTDMPNNIGGNAENLIQSELPFVASRVPVCVYLREMVGKFDLTVRPHRKAGVYAGKVARS